MNRVLQYAAGLVLASIAIFGLRLVLLNYQKTVAINSINSMAAKTTERMKVLNEKAKAERETQLAAIAAQKEERLKLEAAEREARRPKAYRWKDSKGVSHLSDTAPPAGTPSEIIYLGK